MFRGSGAALAAVFVLACKVVLAGVPVGVYIAPGNVGMRAGATWGFSACAYDADGNMNLPISQPVTWSIDAAAGTVDSSGIFHAGMTPGTYYLQVVAPEGQASAQIDVFATPTEPGYQPLYWLGGTSPDAFAQAEGMAFDSSGNLYLVDTYNSRIQKRNPAGTVVSFWGSYGSGDGQFKHPSGVAIDSSNNVYVTDTDNHRVQKFDSSGNFITTWGSQGTGNGQFKYPSGIAVDSSASVYVADSTRVIQKFSSSGSFVDVWGSLRSAIWFIPIGITADSSDNVYATVSSATYPFNSVTKYTPSGNVDSSFRYSGPVGDKQKPIAVDSSKNVYVTDVNGKIRKLSSTGSLIDEWNYYARAMAVDTSDDVFAAGSSNGIKQLSSSGSLIATWPWPGGGSGQFGDPEGIAVDSSGNVYVTDMGINECVQKFSPSGSRITTWGTHGSSEGQFRNPFGIAVDSSGDVYVADYPFGRIQKFDPSGGFICSWTLSPEGYSLRGIAVDSSGCIFALYGSSVQKLSPSGELVATWGSYGTSPGQFSNAEGIAVDASGNVYVADTGNNRIQKFSSSGDLILSWGLYGSGDGQLRQPKGVAVDSSGNVYVADNQNFRVQKFNSSGDFIAAWGSFGSISPFVCPGGVAVDSSGSVYVTDIQGHSRIQKWAYTGADRFSVGTARTLTGNPSIYIDDAVVTATQIQSGVAFIESPDRSAGIKLLTSQALILGQKVKLAGTFGRVDGEYQISNPSFFDLVRGTTLAPVCMNTSVVGNDPTQSLSYLGINTTGLLVRLAGKVTSAVSNIVYVDDGAGYQDGVGPALGIRVYVPPGVTPPGEGQMAVITGISRVEKFVLSDSAVVNGVTYPAGASIYVPSVWVRDQGDVVVP